MWRWRADQSECVEHPLGLVRFTGASTGERRHEASISFRSLVFRLAKYTPPKFATALVTLAFVLVSWGAEVSRAQVSDVEKASYADALAYCQGDVTRPMALRSDKRVLCLDGRILAVSDMLVASGLEDGGLFVVRGYGGDIAFTIALADMLLARKVTVIVSNYCLTICADYLFIASAKTFVPKDALVAWTNHATGPNNCIIFRETGDRGAPRLEELPCDFPSVDNGTRELIRLKKKFYEVRSLSMEEPPESIVVRRILKRKYDATGRYPNDVYWTWNPRYYASAMRTQILYEAYPQSQDEIDAIVTRIGLPNSVIHDP
jgi:hypothetical protein